MRRATIRTKRSDFIVRCPVCGEEKWKYLGTDKPEEPPCFACSQKAERLSQSGRDAR